MRAKPYGSPSRVARLQRQQLARHPQGAAPFEDDERLFLRVVKVIRATALARLDDVDADAELGRGGAAPQTRAERVVERRALLAGLLDVVEIADQLLTQSVGRFAHGVGVVFFVRARMMPRLDVARCLLQRLGHNRAPSTALPIL